MPEKTKGKRTLCWKRSRDPTRCQSRLKENGSSLGEYRRAQENLGIIPAKRSYSGEYWRIQDRKDRIRASTGEDIVFEQVPEMGRIRVSDYYSKSAI
uniref:Uncharacterized protein n=1 Tax=Vitis vinifera TaxID=29760 RepID=A5C424_VITVI|nr:hypothetical protein VITISV_035328 [Vitis vinifera]